MKNTVRALALFLALQPVLAAAQSAPATMPYHTVYGRIGAAPGDTGPGQAIPFKNLSSQLGVMPPATARMWPNAGQVSGPWNVVDPWGNPISTTGTTCQGFDKLVASAATNGWSWQVLGNGTLTCSAPIALPTCFLKAEYIDAGVTIAFTAQGSSNLMTMNSHENCHTLFKGAITQNVADTGAVLVLAPTSNNAAGNTVFAATVLEISSIAPGTGGIGVKLDPTSGSFLGNHITIHDVNGGATGIQVANPGTGSIVVEQNKFFLTYNHGQTTRVVQIGTSATNQSGLRYNVWHPGRIDPNAATVAWDSWASNDTYVDLTISNEGFQAATGLKFESGANQNIVVGGVIQATAPLSDGGVCNSYIGVKGVAGTFSYLGGVSGCTGLSPAGAATGQLTLPAANDTLVARNTTDTLTNKSIAATQLTGTLQAAQEPAHTGDVTNSAGSLALAYTNVVPANKGGAGTITGALRGNGAGTVTQAAMADISDYATGTWTPTLVGSTSGSFTLSTAVGSYERIGRFIRASFTMIATANGAVGNVSIGGLPFTSGATANDNGTCSIGYTVGVTNTASFTQVSGVISASTTQATLYETGSGQTSQPTATARFAATTQLIGTCLYHN